MINYARHPGHWIKFLGDANPDLRQKARSELIKGGEKSLDSLIEALNSVNPTIRKEAAITLGYIGNKKAVQPILKLLEDPDEKVRLEAIVSLMKIGDENSVEPLEEYIRNNGRKKNRKKDLLIYLICNKKELLIAANSCMDVNFDEDGAEEFLERFGPGEIGPQIKWGDRNNKCCDELLIPPAFIRR